MFHCSHAVWHIMSVCVCLCCCRISTENQCRAKKSGKNIEIIHQITDQSHTKHMHTYTWTQETAVWKMCSNSFELYQKSIFFVFYSKLCCCDFPAARKTTAVENDFMQIFNRMEWFGMECVSTCTHVKRLNHSFHITYFYYFFLVSNSFFFSISNWMQINNGKNQSFSFFFSIPSPALFSKLYSMCSYLSFVYLFCSFCFLRWIRMLLFENSLNFKTIETFFSLHSLSKKTTRNSLREPEQTNDNNRFDCRLNVN